MTFSSSFSSLAGLMQERLHVPDELTQAECSSEATAKFEGRQAIVL